MICKLYMVVAVLILGSSLPVVAQQTLRVEAKANQVYHPGLPLVVKVEIVNTSTKVQQVPIPAVPRSNLYFAL
jgi:hypothetical protein